MNIVCDKTLLSSAIDGVSKAVTLRSSIPALEGLNVRRTILRDNKYYILAHNDARKPRLLVVNPDYQGNEP